MRNVLIWVGTVLALVVLLLHVIHLAADYELVLLEVSVVLIGLGIAPIPG